MARSLCSFATADATGKWERRLRPRPMEGRTGGQVIPTWLCGSVCPSVCLMLSSSLSFSFSRRHIARSANSRLAHRHRLPPSPSIDGRLSFETEVERENERAQFNPTNEIGFQAVYPRAFLRFFPCFRFLPSSAPSLPISLPSCFNSRS